MENKDLKLIIAQQIVLMKRIEKIENKMNNRIRSASVSDYQEELRREAMSIIDQIRI